MRQVSGAVKEDRTEDQEPVMEDEPVKTQPSSSNGHKRHVVKLEDVAAAQDLQIEWVETPEWAPAGAANKEEYGLYVRALNGRERAKWQSDITIQKGKNSEVNFMAMTVTLVVLGACDEDGKKLYTDSDRRILLNRNSAVLERIGDRIMELSEMGDKEMEALKGKSSMDLGED